VKALKKTIKRQPRKLPKEFRKKMLTRKDGKTVPKTQGFYLVFIRGDGKDRKYKAISWEYHAESNWCRTRKQAVEKVSSHPRLIID
jgi:hypothetical protein